MSPESARRERFERVAASVFDPLQRYLRRRARLHDADEVLSDVLLVIWRRLEDVPDDRPLPWCYGIARRALANHRRGERRRLHLLQRLSTEPAPHSPDPSDRHADPDLADALARLTASDREVLTLWAWEELESREIAVVLEITPNAASLRLSRARKRLATLLTGQELGDAGHNPGEETEERRK